MRHVMVALCCVCLGGPGVAGQGQQTPPVFRGGVTLIAVDVTVLDRDGKPVAGLTANDFTVKLNGQVRPVRALDYVHVATAKGDARAGAQEQVGAQQLQVQPVTQGRHTVTNAPPTGESRVFVLLIDDLSFAPSRGKAIFLAAERFVTGLPAADAVGFTTSSQSNAVNPTTDRAAIQAALRSTVGEFSDPRALNSAGNSGGKGADIAEHSVGVTEALEIDRGSDSALKQAIARECFGGSTQAIDTQGLQTILASNDCASAVYSQARRTASLTKQTTSRQVEAYLSVIAAMGPAPGIKHLVLLSDGLGLSQDLTSLERVARAAAQAGVQVSVLAQEPDPNMADHDVGQSASVNPNLATDRPTVTVDPPATRRRDDDKTFIAGLQTVADVTGGTFYRIVGAPDPFFERVATASSAVYRLGVESLADTAAGRDFAVVVSVGRPGVLVHANRHAVAPSPSAGAPDAPPVPIEDQLKTAISVGPPVYGVPISLATALKRSASPPGAAGQAGGQSNATTIDLGVSVQVPSTVKGPLATMFGIADAAGSLRSGRRTVEPPPDGGDYRVSFAVPVAPGRYRVRFAVADADGHVGSVESAVTAELGTVGPFLASDVLTLAVDATGKAQFLALEDLPPTAVTLSTSLELYPTPGAAPSEAVKVRFALVGSNQAHPAVEHDVTPGSANGTLRAAADFSLAALPPGVYTLRATVSVGGADVGMVAATIRKR